MNTNRNTRTIFIVILVLALVGVAYWFFFVHSAEASSGLTASGTVETTEISIAPELSGKVASVNVAEGDNVKEGEVLFTLDDTLLQAQKVQAEAELAAAQGSASTAEAAAASAQSQYEIALSAALAADKKGRTADWFGGTPAGFEQPMWYFDKGQQIAAVQAEIDGTQKDLTAAQAQLAVVQQAASSSDFLSAEANLAEARVEYQVARQVLNEAGDTKSDMWNQIDNATPLGNGLLALPNGGTAFMPNGFYRVKIRIIQRLANGGDLHDAAQTTYNDAKDSLDDAQTAYDDALLTAGAADVLKARAQVAVAQEEYYTAQDYLRKLQTGPEALQVTAAQKALDQANQGTDQAKLSVGQAQASLDLIEAQIEKLTVKAPVDGVILTRAVEPGEVVNPGSVVLTMGKLSELTITVYVPENQVGQVRLGQNASVTVDSFPGQSFNATVTYISDQAEFTPRNVQTVEGRQTTVFAVKLKLEDTTGRLKPGMPADVSFSK